MLGFSAFSLVILEFYEFLAKPSSSSSKELSVFFLWFMLCFVGKWLTKQRPSYKLNVEKLHDKARIL